MHHAEKMALKRLPFKPNMEKLARRVREGRARFVCFGYQDRRIYDVPDYGGETIRVIMNPELTVVISVLPPQFRHEKYQQFTRKLGRERRAIARTEVDETGVESAAV